MGWEIGYFGEIWGWGKVGGMGENENLGRLGWGRVSLGMWECDGGISVRGVRDGG